jgi:hypothetical protein
MCSAPVIAVVSRHAFAALCLVGVALQDGKPRNSYSHIEALPTSGPTSSCGACCSYAHWTAVVGGKAHGQYHSQAVAAYVADCVRQHFDPDATHLNFTPEVWQQVSTAHAIAELSGGLCTCSYVCERAVCKLSCVIGACWCHGHAAVS